MNQKQREGRIGEIEAALYLKKNGYKIICMNFKCMQGEIDIIAEKNNMIVFIEVKTRTSKTYGEAREAVDLEKQKHIYRAAEYFLYKTQMEEVFTRIDVIEIYLYNRESYNKPHKTDNININEIFVFQIIT